MSRSLGSNCLTGAEHAVFWIQVVLLPFSRLLSLLAVVMGFFPGLDMVDMGNNFSQNLWLYLCVREACHIASSSGGKDSSRSDNGKHMDCQSTLLKP